MERREFTREFKVEAVRLVKERGVTVKQAARDLNVHENVLRKWVKDFGADPQHAFPGQIVLSFVPHAIETRVLLAHIPRDALARKPVTVSSN